jgi:hypothetical protein
MVLLVMAVRSTTITLGGMGEIWWWWLVGHILQEASRNNRHLGSWRGLYPSSIVPLKFGTFLGMSVPVIDSYFQTVVENGRHDRGGGFYRLPFTARLRQLARDTQDRDPWLELLSTLTGRISNDGVERVSSDALMEFLDLPPHERTPKAARRIRSLMISLHWVPVRAMLLTATGARTRVRGYARCVGR